MVTNIRFLFDVITKASCPAENKLMTDLHTVKHAHKTFEFSEAAHKESTGRSIAIGDNNARNKIWDKESDRRRRWLEI